MKKMYRADMSIRMIITTNMITSMHAAARMIILTIMNMNMNMSIITPILTPA